jgi:hypothetical protein
MKWDDITLKISKKFVLDIELLQKLEKELYG